MKTTIGNMNEYKFKMTPAPPMGGSCYFVTFTPFWRWALRWITFLHDRIGEQAKKSATYTLIRGPENGLYIDEKSNNKLSLSFEDKPWPGCGPF
jgi:hypothetical protein